MIFFGPVSTGQFRQSTCNMGVQGGFYTREVTRCISYTVYFLLYMANRAVDWDTAAQHTLYFKPHPFMHVVSDISSNEGFLIYLVKGYFDNVKSSTRVIDTWQGN